MNIQPTWWLLVLFTFLGFLWGSYTRSHEVRVLKLTVRYLIDTVGRLRAQLKHHKIDVSEQENDGVIIIRDGGNIHDRPQ